jgi:hypothetical protein
MPRGTWTTSTTPGTAFAAVASKDLTVAPNSGGRCSTATSMPGKVTSRVNWAVPLLFAGTSTRGSFWPISLKSLGSFRVTLAASGCAAALPASSPKLACRREAAWLSTPRSTTISAAGTFHSAAAAATSMARAVAPAWRSCIQEFAIALLPPVPWIVPKARLL